MVDGLPIGELVTRTGVSEGTLRMWERRHGFPEPRAAAERSPPLRRRGCRAGAPRRARARRRASRSRVAIARARDSAERIDPSVFAGLRRRRPELAAACAAQAPLLALSRAIEDESCARAERPLLFGSFQRERFYRQSERRWRDFARTAELTVVFADFERSRLAGPGARSSCRPRGFDPLSREWAVVCEAPGHAACLAGVELPG